MTEENKAITRREVEEIFSGGKLEVAYEIYAADFVDHDPPLSWDMHGPEDMKEYVGMYRSAFPDLEVTLEDQVAEGDKVANRWTARGTHEGEYLGLAPTGKRVTFTGIHISRINEEGTIAESWDNYDALGLLRQIGAVSLPGQEVES
jgi:steroid delta-isomerase-like uncharacterized protein